MDLKDTVLSGLKWSAGTRFLCQAVTWAITIIVVRVLTPGDYGLFALALVFVTFCGLVNQLGLGTALIQKKAIGSEILSNVFGLLLLVNILFFMLLYFSAPIIASYFNEQRIEPIIHLLSFQFLLSGFSIIPESLLTRQMNFKILSKVDLTSSLIGSIITLVLALQHFGVWSLTWGSLAMSITKTLTLNIYLPYIQMPRFSFTRMPHILSFGSIVTVHQIVYFIFSQADIFIIGKVLGNEPLGYYSVSNDFANMPMDKLSGILNLVALPAFATIQNEAERVGNYLLKAVRLLSIFAFPVCWGMSCIAPELIHLVLGEKWHQAAVLVQLLCLVVPIRMISNLLHPTLLARGCPLTSLFNLLSTAVVIPLGIWIGSYWGLVGVAIAWVSLFPLVFLTNLCRSASVLSIKSVNVISATGKPACAAFIMYLAVTGIKSMTKDKLGPVPELMLLIILGAIVYTGIFFLFWRDRSQEVMALLQKS